MCLPTELEHSTYIMGRISEEGVRLERTFDVSSLMGVSKSEGNQLMKKLTSTASNMATTKTSSAEFLQPTTTPVNSDRGKSVGQNIRINPSCSGMTDNGLLGAYWLE